MKNAQGIYSSNSFVLMSTWYQNLRFKVEPKQEKNSRTSQNTEQAVEVSVLKHALQGSVG